MQFTRPLRNKFSCVSSYILQIVGRYTELKNFEFQSPWALGLSPILTVHRFVSAKCKSLVFKLRSANQVRFRVEKYPSTRGFLTQNLTHPAILTLSSDLHFVRKASGVPQELRKPTSGWCDRRWVVKSLLRGHFGVHSPANRARVVYFEILSGQNLTGHPEQSPRSLLLATAAPLDRAAV